MDFLDGHGFEQYEISNYARPGYECRHNLAYWHGQDYLGIGPSAFSTVGRSRWQNIADTQGYIERVMREDSVKSFEETLEGITRDTERIVFGLRTNHGILRSQIGQQTAELSDLEKAGYVETVGNYIRLTKAGRLLADEIGTLFV
jgi:oxygen-independent coproporphyrinogen-3 oxidase